jgi:hypothetical protein
VRYPIVPEKGDVMARSIEKVFTFFIVIILSILLLDLLGPFIANSITPASDQVSNILHNTWVGVNHIAHTGSNTYGSSG